MVFRAPASSLECCCFISNQEFLSGSDDGGIAHWNILRKKPVHIVKNAHASVSAQNREEANGELSNGRMGKFSSRPLSSTFASLTFCLYLPLFQFLLVSFSLWTPCTLYTKVNFIKKILVSLFFMRLYEMCGLMPSLKFIYRKYFSRP